MFTLSTSINPAVYLLFPIVLCWVSLCVNVLQNRIELDWKSHVRERYNDSATDPIKQPHAALTSHCAQCKFIISFAVEDFSVSSDHFRGWAPVYNKIGFEVTISEISWTFNWLKHCLESLFFLLFTLKHLQAFFSKAAYNKMHRKKHVKFN